MSRHSRTPPPSTSFDKTAARKDYAVFDLTSQTPLLTAREKDESKRRWDAKDETGLRFQKGVKNVEYFRDIRPIFPPSCVACHTGKADRPAGNLVPDDDTTVTAQNPAGLGFSLSVPGTYARLAADAAGRWGHKPLHRHGWTDLAASRYVRMLQSRRSLLIWKVFGKRLDGWDNDDFPYEAMPGDPHSLRHKGKPVPDTPRNRELAHVGTGLDRDSFRVVADFPLEGTPAGENLAPKFRPAGQGVWELKLKLAKPLTDLPGGRLTVAVKDRQGNETRIERTFSVGKAAGAR